MALLFCISLLVSASVFRRRATFSLLEVSAEGGLVGEMELLGYLLEAHVGVFQVLPHERHCYTLYPLHGTLAAFPLDDGGEVIGREMLQVGIELHSALQMIILVE